MLITQNQMCIPLKIKMTSINTKISRPRSHLLPLSSGTSLQPFSSRWPSSTLHGALSPAVTKSNRDTGSVSHLNNVESTCSMGSGDASGLDPSLSGPSSSRSFIVRSSTTWTWMSQSHWVRRRRAALRAKSKKLVMMSWHIYYSKWAKPPSSTNQAFEEILRLQA